MNSEWKIMELKDLISLKTGKLDSNFAEDDGKYPFFTCAPNPLSINSFSFDQKAILLAGNNANGIFHINYFEGKFDAYQRTYVISVLDENKLNLKYLFYALKICLAEFRRISQGTSTKFLTKRILDKFEIKVPPIDTQLQIVEILDSLDKKIKSNEKINQNLERISDIIFEKWFLSCSDDWDEINFGDLIKISSGKRPINKSEIKIDEFIYPLFGASSIVGYTDEFLFDDNILIIGRVGTHGVVQRVNYKSFPSDNTLVVETEYYNFVYQILKRIDYSSLNTGSTQPLLTQKSIKNVKINLPPIKLLIKYESFCVNLFHIVDKNKREIFYLEQLKDSLLPKLMSGELDVSNVKI